MAKPITTEEAETSRFTPKLYGIVLLACGIVLLGLWLISKFTAIDYARDIRNWQEKLNLVANSRVGDVENYIGSQFKELRTLADNPSLQLYLTELESAKDAPQNTQKKTIPGDEPAEISYLRNLLIFTAERGGYSQSTALSAIPANVESAAKNGLAVVNKAGEIVVSSAMPQNLKDLLIAHANVAKQGSETLIDIAKDDEGVVYMGFVVPIYSIQGEHTPEAQIGKIVGIKTLDDSFFGLLRHPGVTEETLEAVLVRAEDDKITFLSPLLDKSTPLSKTIENDVNKFAEARLMDTGGHFIADMRDYSNKKVLATSRDVAGTSWKMILKVGADEALSESNKQRTTMVAIFFLIIGLIVLTIIAIWWYASSKRSLMMSYYFRKLAAKAQAKERLLRLVADHQPEPIYILDKEGIYHFANKPAGDAAEMSPENIIGKLIRDVRGTARAHQVMEMAHTAMAQNHIAFHNYQQEDAGVVRSFRSAYVPVDHIPISSLPTPTAGILVVEQDITQAVNEREKRLQINQDLISTLVSLVDRRDPFAANHSLLVSHVAQHVAQGMELDSTITEAARIAASLMNIGKIVVPQELLTKTNALTDDELVAVRSSMHDAAELIKNIHFDGPVYDTLTQWQEKWDGSGFLGLKGDAILISARILAVSNTFIGMISPRSWRTAMSIEAATKFLMENSDTHFDRKVVAALIHYVENQHGKDWLKQVMDSQKNTA